MTIQNTDQYVVESNGTDFSVESQNVDQKVQDDDLFVVCRSGTPYKATYAEVKESMVVPAPPIMLSASLVEADPEGDRFTSQSFVASSQVIEGEPISTKTIDAHVDGTLSRQVQFDEPLESSATVSGNVGGLNPYDSFSSGHPESACFDGNLDTYAEVNNTDGSTTNTLDWYPASNTVPVGSLVQIRSDSTGMFNCTPQQTFTAITTPFVGYEATIVEDPQNASLQYLSFVRTAQSYGTPNQWNAIYVDGVMLEDEAVGLTFANSTDMEGLAAGDIVSQTVPGPAAPISGLTTLYSGNAATQNIVNGIDLANDGGLVWFKNRESNSTNHWLVDTVRGLNEALLTNNTTDEIIATVVSSFNTNGFTLPSNSSVNTQSLDYVAWSFGKAEKYFDIVEYTGNGAAAQTINHSLATKPGFVITKQISGGDSSWICWHTGLTSEQWYITLDDAYAQADGSVATNWAITDTTFDVCNAVGNNVGTKSYIAYVFAEDTPSVIKCGMFSGTGTVDVGFEPQWVLFKASEATAAWYIVDNKRGTANQLNSLSPNTDEQENPGNDWQFTSTGWTQTSFGYPNQIYVAIAAPPAGPSGTVASVVDTTATLFNSSGTWVNGSNVTGPQKTIVEENARLYCAFDSSGNITDLQNNPQDPPYTTTDSNPGLTLTFPATFPSGQTPDEELPDGTTLTVDVSAANDSGTSGPVSATVQPESDTPDSPLAGLTTLYNGNTTGQAIINGIDNVTNDGLIWIKARDGSTNNLLYDTLRGVDSVLFSNTSNDAQAQPPLVSFNNNGFSLGSESVSAINQSGVQYAAWNFGKAEGYFDVVQFNNSGQLVPHALGTKPGFIITKFPDSSGDWVCYHSSITNANSIKLNTTDGSGPTDFSDNEPDATNFSLSEFNWGSGNCIAYLFAEDTPGVIKCGEYIGANSGASVVTGFKPQWLLVKCVSTSGDWMLFDDKRGVNTGSPPESSALNPNEAFSEQTSNSFNVEFNDDGFVFPGINQSVSGPNAEYIYVAIAEPPDAVSMTTAQLAETQLKFATFENRSMVKCGNDAEAARDALIQELALQGYSLPDILELL